MRVLKTLLVTLLVVGLAGATAYGAGLLSTQRLAEVGAWATDRPSGDPGDQGIDGPAARVDAPERRPSAPEPEREPKREPRGPVLEPGDRGVEVRELQSRLFQIAWFPELTTGRYGAMTRQAVSGFQAKRGLESTGVVDRRTWHRLLDMTRKPTHDQLFNVLRPGPALLARGDSGEAVRDLRARLVSIQWLFGDVSGSFDSATVEAVRGFQAKREIPVTGEVDQRTLDRLHAMTVQPTYEQMHNIEPKLGALDPRCKVGEALCIDKSTNSLRWVVDGEVEATFDVRFGSDELPTREGAFTVFHKSRNHVSSLYDTSMPFAMFFSGGQAVHYSPDFAATGYNGASHGCVNVRDYDGIAWLYDQIDIGTPVIVYWS
jgi:peptidoglycan hydrolase-like protein with peptidoglycan-binding domain